MTERDEEYNRFVALLARSEQSIRRLVRFLMPSPDGVDDVMQDVALECWKKFDQFSCSDLDRQADEFIRWANVIARFKVMSWQRDRSRDRLVFRDAVVEKLFESAGAGDGQLQEERDAVDACLKELPLDQRRLVLSVHTPGDSVQSIAAETGKKVRQLYTIVNNLRSLLLTCIRRRVAAEGHGG
ncbi:MAG: sigma-70 family RNA polymerase sigma factor [Aureliella sp.]